MSHSAPHAAAPAADIYPAGASYSHGHHGHVVVSQRMLLSVFMLLLFFTGLTVALAKGEVWFMETFRIDLPGWVNVAVALSIAAVKSTIVALYFMQLRYDNPTNAIIAIFTIFVLAFFLGFTMIDLGNRGAIYSYKAQHIIQGGTGGLPIPGSDGKSTTEPIAVHARNAALAEIASLRAEGKPLPKRLQKFADHGIPHEHSFGAVVHTSSSANASRPRTGVTIPELMPAGSAPAAKPETHGGGH
jgi:cytochrome c oxidase subunit IV